MASCDENYRRFCNKEEFLAEINRINDGKNYLLSDFDNYQFTISGTYINGKQKYDIHFQQTAIYDKENDTLIFPSEYRVTQSWADKECEEMVLNIYLILRILNEKTINYFENNFNDTSFEINHIAGDGFASHTFHSLLIYFGNSQEKGEVCWKSRPIAWKSPEYSVPTPHYYKYESGEEKMDLLFVSG